MMSKALDAAGKGDESYERLQLEFKKLAELEEEEVRTGQLDEKQAEENQRNRLLGLDQTFAIKAELGKTVQKLTIECCTTFANKFNYLFYVGKDYIPGKTYVAKRITPATRDFIFS
jgi:hypothetical protein